MKDVSPNAVPLVICHFEDEPGKVDLPELIEAALYDTEGVSDSGIEFPRERNKYTIKYKYEEVPKSLVYLVEPSEEAMSSALNGLDEHRLALSIVDMSLGSDKSAGIKIVRNLLVGGRDPDTIWMLTAYPVEALRQSREMTLPTRVYVKPDGIRIIPKPGDHRLIIDDIFDMLSDILGEVAA